MTKPNKPQPDEKTDKMSQTGQTQTNADKPMAKVDPTPVKTGPDSKRRTPDNPEGVEPAWMEGRQPARPGQPRGPGSGPGDGPIRKPDYEKPTEMRRGERPQRFTPGERKTERAADEEEAAEA